MSTAIHIPRSIGSVLMGGLLCCCGAAMADVPGIAANAIASNPTTPGGNELTVDVDAVMVDLTPQRPTRELLSPATQYGAGTRTMAWSRNGAMQFGVGVEQPWPGSQTPTMPGLAPQPRMVLGASVDTGANTQLRWRTPLPATLAREATQQPQLMEVSLVLKPTDALANLRRGSLMKLELSGQTQLSLRPRGGGRMALTLTSKW